MTLLLFGILFCSKSTSAETKNLVFLNCPEKVTKSGKLGKQIIKKSSNTRIFFHYLNATGQDQTFYFRAEGKINNYKIGYHVNFEPGIAGATAIANFYNKIYTDKQNILIKVTVPNRHTISGIAEGYFFAGNYWICRLGPGDYIKGIKIINTKIDENLSNIKLDDDKEFVFRLGDDKNQCILGNYGFDYKFQIKNTTSSIKTLFCKINPRGGNIIGVFNINGKVYMTKDIKTKENHTFYAVVLKPDEYIYIKYIPTGGYNYPIELKFDLNPVKI